MLIGVDRSTAAEKSDCGVSARLEAEARSPDGSDGGKGGDDRSPGELRIGRTGSDQEPTRGWSKNAIYEAPGHGQGVESAGATPMPSADSDAVRQLGL